jgi:hypothetical protein
MNREVTYNVVRTFLFMLIQVVLLKRLNIDSGLFVHIHLFFYPLALMMFPFQISRALLLLFAFLMGLVLDIFYDSPGVHAGSSVLLVFLRDTFTKWLEPRGGYQVNAVPVPAHMGNTWFFSYAAMGMGLYIFTFFSLQAFSPVFILSVIIKSLFSFTFSMTVIAVYTLIFNPKS